MKFWFFSLVLMSATVFGVHPHTSDGEHYQQILQDFANGAVPKIELLAEREWWSGRCVYQEKPGDLKAAILEIRTIDHGPYYGTKYEVFLHRDFAGSLRPDFFDRYRDGELGNELIKRSRIVTPISEYQKSMRSFEEILLVSIKDGMCYFF